MCTAISSRNCATPGFLVFNFDEVTRNLDEVMMKRAILSYLFCIFCLIIKKKALHLCGRI